MKPTPIYQDHTGQWREQNPFSQHLDDYSSQVKYRDFEQSITYHPFPNAPEKKQGEVVMARLQWQELGWAGNWVNVEEINKDPDPYDARQIWVAVTDSAKEEEAKIDYQERIDKLKNQISHYKSQCDEMLALQQQKERELESLRQKYNEGLL